MAADMMLQVQGLSADKGHDMHRCIDLCHAPKCMRMHPGAVPHSSRSANGMCRVSGADLEVASLDLLGPGGLLERVLSHLGIPEAEWPAVRRLPSSSVAIAEAVATHRVAVDSALKQLPQPPADSVALASRRGLTPAEKQQQV